MIQNFLRIREVSRVTGLPRATIYEMAAKGTFPRQVRLSPRAVGWVESEILDWQRSKIALRDASVEQAHGRKSKRANAQRLGG
jgi:prophage regulatory protein